MTEFHWPERLSRFICNFARLEKHKFVWGGGGAGRPENACSSKPRAALHSKKGQCEPTLFVLHQSSSFCQGSSNNTSFTRVCRFLLRHGSFSTGNTAVDGVSESTLRFLEAQAPRAESARLPNGGASQDMVSSGGGSSTMLSMSACLHASQRCLSASRSRERCEFRARERIHSI